MRRLIQSNGDARIVRRAQVVRLSARGKSPSQIADILERAASTDPDKIVAATRLTNFTNHPVVSGPIQFNEKGDNTGALTALIQVQPDADLFKRVKIVAPKEFAQSDKIVFPAPQLWKR